MAGSRRAGRRAPQGRYHHQGRVDHPKPRIRRDASPPKNGRSIQPSTPRRDRLRSRSAIAGPPCQAAATDRSTRASPAAEVPYKVPRRSHTSRSAAMPISP
jgi:hypothetical protein